AVKASGMHPRRRGAYLEFALRPRSGRQVEGLNGLCALQSGMRLQRQLPGDSLAQSAAQLDGYLFGATAEQSLAPVPDLDGPHNLDARLERDRLTVDQQGCAHEMGALAFAPRRRLGRDLQ